MIYILIVIFILIDFISKIIISNSLVVGNSISVIGDFFRFNYVKNTGVAWSLFSGYQYGIITITLLIIGGLIFYCKKKSNKSKIEIIGYSLLIGGSIGNLIDRIRLGYVIDFLDFKIFGYDYPIFNIADSFIFCGIILLVIWEWRNSNGN